MSLTKRFLPVVLGVSAAAGCGDEAATKTRDSATSTAKTGEAKKSAAPTASAGQTPTVLKRNDPIPERLGGAAMPAPRPVLPGSAGALAPAAPAPAPAAPRAAGAAAAAPEAASPAPAAVTEVAIVHNHPPDQPCQPLTDAEVKKAFGDL